MKDHSLRQCKSTIIRRIARCIIVFDSEDDTFVYAHCRSGTTIPVARASISSGATARDYEISLVENKGRDSLLPRASIELPPRTTPNPLTTNDACTMSTVLLPTSALALVAWLIIRQLAKLTKKPKLDMPHLNFKNGDNSMQRYFNNSETILEQGYEQYLKKGLPFSMFNCMDASTPMAVLPVKYLGEVRNASTSKLSLASLLNKVHWAAYVSVHGSSLGGAAKNSTWVVHRCRRYRCPFGDRSRDPRCPARLEQGAE